MATTRDSAARLDSLYEALEIPRVGEVKCLGHTRSGGECKYTWKTQRDKIEPVLHNMIDAIDGGAATSSVEFQWFLRGLARLLTCPRPTHLPRDREEARNFDPSAYVYSILGPRLENWNTGNGEETLEIERSKTPSLPAVHITAPTTPLQTRRPSENHDRAQSCDETDDDDVVIFHTAPCRQRPQLTRKKPMMDQSVFHTPTKQRGRPSHNPPASTPRTRQLVDGIGSLSLADDAPIESPASVASPDPSPIFSPVSNVSTPMSICVHPDSESRPLRSRYARGEEGSPTRKSRPLPGDDLLEDTMRRMRINSEDPTPDPWLTPKHGNDYPTRERSRSGGGERLEQSLQLGDQGPESERQTHDKKESKKQPANQEGKDSPLNERVGNMTFAPKPNLRNPVGVVLTRMRQVAEEDSRAPGWVYCFAEKSAPGFLKIGYKKGTNNTGDTVPSTEYQENDTEAKKRIQQWEIDCKHDIVPKFIIPMPCCARVMEGLVHKTFRSSRRIAWCPNPACGKGHREWFEISEEEARKAVMVWKRFSELMPYNDLGRLKDFWDKYAAENEKRFGIQPAEEWLHERWAKMISPAAVERREQIVKLKERGDKLVEERRENVKKRRELEREIKNLIQEEEEIRQQLAMLEEKQREVDRV